MLSNGCIRMIDDDVDLRVSDEVADWPGLPVFYQSSFFRIHAQGRRGFYFSLIKRKSNRMLGAGHFIEDGLGVFKSPFRGSYGGVFFVSDVSLEKIDKTYASIESFLIEQGARRIVITLAPFVYSSQLNSVTYNSLVRRSYGVCRHELNYSISIDSRNFSERIDYGNRKKIAKGIREGLIARALESTEFEAAYNIIAANRSKNGFQISLDWSSLAEMIFKMPDVVLCFGVFEADQMIASSVCMCLSPSILYVFYWGERPGVESMSPVSLIADMLYKYCQEQRISILDLGTSTVHGVPSYGLIRYKKNLGSEESLKLTFMKDTT
jgi:hypothetical protein